jgi:hypothetical protein
MEYYNCYLNSYYPKFDDVPLIRWCLPHAEDMLMQARVVDVTSIRCALIAFVT